MLKARAILATLPIAVAAVVLQAEAASACGLDGSCGGGNGDGRGNPTPSTGEGGITVTISGSGTTGGSDGSFTIPAEDIMVIPACHYFQAFTGKEYYEFVEQSGTGYDPETHEPVPPYPHYKKYKNDTEGHWWAGVCDGGYWHGKPDKFGEHAEDWFDNDYDGPTYVEPGETPPIPPVPPEVLLYYAQEHLDIPQPDINWNPKITDSDGATLVNVDTWVWLTEDSPIGLDVTASAGGNSATVYATQESMTVSAPTMNTVTCEGHGVAWSHAASNPCVAVFERSSASESDSTTDVTVTTNWSTRWAANGVARGELDPISQQGVTEVPVNEIQTTVTDVD